MSDLKPCPFCGSEIEFIPSHIEEQNFVNSASIICRKCRKEYVGATFIVPGEIESEELTNNILINWWNNRPAEDALKAEVEDLKQRLSDSADEGYAGFMLGIEQMKKKLAEKDAEIAHLNIVVEKLYALLKLSRYEFEIIANWCEENNMPDDARSYNNLAAGIQGVLTETKGEQQ